MYGDQVIFYLHSRLVYQANCLQLILDELSFKVFIEPRHISAIFPVFSYP